VATARGLPSADAHVINLVLARAGNRCRVLAETRQKLPVPCWPCRTQVSGFRGEGSGRDVVVRWFRPSFGVSRGGVGSRGRCCRCGPRFQGFAAIGQTATSSSALCVVSPFSSRQIPRPLWPIWATNLRVAGRRSTWDQIARKASPSLKSTKATEAAWQASQNTRF
jgi:hypothetical protein